MKKESTMRTVLLISICALCAFGTFAQANQKTDIEKYLDTWLTANSKAHVEIYQTDKEDIYAGKVVWHMDPDQKDNVGQDMVENLQYDVDNNKFINGTIDMDGKSAKCEMQLKGNNELEVKLRRGLIKKTVIWTRVD
jgi:uncharacterized protein (DUF2147 family)